MKTAKQIKVDNRTTTIITCDNCGKETQVKASIDTKTVSKALERSCSSCQPHFYVDGWWHQFGLKANPYVYGPMQRLRTGRDYRMQEARRMGWMAWTWDDEYTEARKCPS